MTTSTFVNREKHCWTIIYFGKHSLLKSIINLIYKTCFKSVKLWTGRYSHAYTHSSTICGSKEHAIDYNDQRHTIDCQQSTDTIIIIVTQRRFNEQWYMNNIIATLEIGWLLARFAIVDLGLMSKLSVKTKPKPMPIVENLLRIISFEHKVIVYTKEGGKRSLIDSSMWHASTWITAYLINNKKHKAPIAH